MIDARGDAGDNIPETYGPKRFVFNVPKDQVRPNKESSRETKSLKKNIEAEKHMPFIFNFPDPGNHKENYSVLVRSILSVYNHLRLLVVEEHYEEFKHIIKEFKIHQPTDCLAIIKEILNYCCEKIAGKKTDSRDSTGPEAMKDYEELIQKAEAKIRVFIRNEQIFRINFDLLSQKIEDAEKSLQEVENEREISKQAREVLAKENYELMSKLRQKDDEIRKIQKERDALMKKQKSSATNNVNIVDKLHQTINAIDPHQDVSSSQNWNHQLLSMLVKENKLTPTETTSGRLGSNSETRAYWNEQKSTTRYSAGDRSQNDKKANVSINNLLNASSGNLRKSDRPKNPLVTELKRNPNANKNILNASLDMALNRSLEFPQERSSVGGNTLSAKKRDSHRSKLGNSHDQIRMKPHEKKKLGEYSDTNLSSLLSNKNALQKIMDINNRYSIPLRPTSTGKSRETSFVSKNRTQTEHSPDAKSYDSKILHNYATSKQSGDSGSKRKSSRSRENRPQSGRGNAKSSLLIKNMIAEQLNKKLNVYK